MSRLVHDTLKFGGGLLMVWGHTSWNGTGSACKIDGRIDGDLCIKVLEEELMPSIGYLHKTTSQVLFQQDSDPKHTCKKAKDWSKCKHSSSNMISTVSISHFNQLPLAAAQKEAQRAPHTTWRDTGAVGEDGEGVGGHSTVSLQGFGGEYAQECCSSD